MKKLFLCLLLSMMVLGMKAQSDYLTMLLGKGKVELKSKNDSIEITPHRGNIYDLDTINNRDFVFSYVGKISLDYSVKNGNYWKCFIIKGNDILCYGKDMKSYVNEKDGDFEPFQLVCDTVKVHLKQGNVEYDFVLAPPQFPDTWRFEENPGNIIETKGDTICLGEKDTITISSFLLKKDKIVFDELDVNGQKVPLDVNGQKVPYRDYGKDYIFVELDTPDTLTRDGEFSIKYAGNTLYQIPKVEKTEQEAPDTGFLNKYRWLNLAIAAALFIAIAVMFFLLLSLKKKKGNDTGENGPTDSGETKDKGKGNNTSENGPTDLDETKDKGKGDDTGENGSTDSGNTNLEGADKKESANNGAQNSESADSDNNQSKDIIKNLKSQIEQLKGENEGLKADLEKLSSNHNEGGNVSSVSIGAKIRKQWTNISTPEKTMDEWFSKGELKKLLYAILKEEFKSKTEIKKLFENKDIDSIDSFKNQLDVILRNSNTHSTFDLSSKYFSSLSVEEKKKVHEFIWQQYTKACGSVPGIDGTDLESIKKHWFDVMVRAQKDPNEEMIKAAQNGTLPEDVKNSVVSNMVSELNAKIKEESLRFSSTNCDELVGEISEKINNKLDAVDIDNIAKEKAMNEIAQLKEQHHAEIEKLGKEKNDAVNEAENGKQEAEKRITVVEKERDEAKNQLENAKQQIQTNKNTYEENKKKQEEKHAQEIADLRSTHQVEMKKALEEAQIRLDKQIEDDKKDKEASVNAVILEKETVQSKLDAEAENHQQEIKKRKECMTAYVSLVKSTLTQVQTSVQIAYQGKDSDSPLASLVSNSIMDNMVYSFVDFENDINKVLEKAEEKELPDFKKQLQKVYSDCLEQKMPTWLDVLSRLYAYSNVGFIAEQFVQKGVNLTHVGEAFLATKSLLSQLEIEITMPALFKDIYDSEHYDLQSVRNIEGYVDDIASHVDSDSVIVDIYTVGFKVNGETKEKPVVSKF